MRMVERSDAFVLPTYVSQANGLALFQQSRKHFYRRFQPGTDWGGDRDGTLTNTQAGGQLFTWRNRPTEELGLAMQLFDRFMSTESGAESCTQRSMDEIIFVAIRIAAKLHNQKPFSMGIRLRTRTDQQSSAADGSARDDERSQQSRPRSDGTGMGSIEWTMCKALDWDLNQVTPYSIAKALLLYSAADSMTLHHLISCTVKGIDGFMLCDSRFQCAPLAIALGSISFAHQRLGLCKRQWSEAITEIGLKPHHHRAAAHAEAAFACTTPSKTTTAATPKKGATGASTSVMPSISPTKSAQSRKMKQLQMKQQQQQQQQQPKRRCLSNAWSKNESTAEHEVEHRTRSRSQAPRPSVASTCRSLDSAS